VVSEFSRGFVSGTIRTFHFQYDRFIFTAGIPEEAAGVYDYFGLFCVVSNEAVVRMVPVQDSLFIDRTQKDLRFLLDKLYNYMSVSNPGDLEYFRLLIEIMYNPEAVKEK
jgi:hypothetical protein